VHLAVFDVQGRAVVKLVEGRMNGGYHEVNFNGSALASGAYFYRIQAGSFVQTRKLLLLK
jgi:glucuronoarabinoxylan endo-1,4-beta-xylanase